MRYFFPTIPIPGPLGILAYKLVGFTADLSHWSWNVEWVKPNRAVGLLGIIKLKVLALFQFRIQAFTIDLDERNSLTNICVLGWLMGIY